MLSRDQSDAYRRDGFLLLEDVFPVARLARLRDASAAIVEDFDVDRHRSVFSTRRDAARDEYFLASAEAVHCFLEEGALDGQGALTRPKALAINKIGHALHDLVPEFTRFCRQPLLAEVARDIGHSAPTLWQTMIILKPPGIGGEVRWHQDATYLNTTPSSVTGFWIALEDATRDNGCLWMAPGAHQGPLREVYEMDWTARRGAIRRLDDSPWPDLADAVPLEAKAGSLVMFHDHMPHYSAANRSDRSRQAFTMHVAEADARWSPANWLQRPNLGAFEL